MMRGDKVKMDISSGETDSPWLIFRNRCGFILVDKGFPVGMFILLTGLLWIGDHGYYSKLFYWFLLLPTLLLVIVQPRSFMHMFGSRIVIAYLVFALYMSVSIFWSSPDDSVLSLIKHPLFSLLLFFSVFELAQRRFDLLCLVLNWAAIFAAVAASITIARFVGEAPGTRLAGYGAFYNPLLISHVFGFFVALWFGMYFMESELFRPISLLGILICGALLFATGSRTPLVAMVAAVSWLAALSANRKAVVVLGSIFLLGIGVLALAPEVITQRGLSYRTEIWANALRQIAEVIWFGHGHGSPLSIQLDGVPYPFSEPHNLTLQVFYDGGVVGLVLWLSIYVVALERSWQLRTDKWVLACSATVVYGMAAGLTEGGALFSRPEEHWFLIWIPLALLSATIYRGRTDVQAE